MLAARQGREAQRVPILLQCSADGSLNQRPLSYVNECIQGHKIEVSGKPGTWKSLVLAAAGCHLQVTAGRDFPSSSVSVIISQSTSRSYNYKENY